ncbi:hypothetical protein K435DRAFT_861026 [Dendrothele bispora CBS 962.96]|uniref:Uncharacterized protein n=1 Tax=Dendrothele bispora (strain CBS 962.96) TaxID=1314807 RepID=A0A4S8KYY2_DENBC|nr:hypothetical protein K435DRAFT_873511 [Dendrothele bispora CBS 962.96]THU93963.1 hypothetical protein K435DRAFT_861026 [Dendrothele bispora CBS 962.96]
MSQNFSSEYAALRSKINVKVRCLSTYTDATLPVAERLMGVHDIMESVVKLGDHLDEFLSDTEMHDPVFRVRSANETLNRNHHTEHGPYHRDIKALTGAIHEERQRRSNTSAENQGNNPTGPENADADSMVVDDTNDNQSSSREGTVRQKVGRIPKTKRSASKHGGDRAKRARNNEVISSTEAATQYLTGNASVNIPFAFSDSVHTVNAAASAVENEATQELMLQAQSAVLDSSLGSVNEEALRRQESNLRAELHTLTHKIEFSMKMRDLLLKEHKAVLRCMDTRLSDNDSGDEGVRGVSKVAGKVKERDVVIVESCEPSGEGSSKDAEEKSVRDA